MKALPLLMATVLPATAEIGSVAHPEDKLPQGQTVVWTPLFQASWDKLNATHGGKPVKIEPPNVLISRLDAFTWKAESVMPEDRWKVWSGPATDEFLATVNAEAAKLTGEEKGPFRLENRQPGTVAVFGLLDREVTFRQPLHRSRKVPMTFRSGAMETKVKFFGVKGQLSEEFSGTVRVLAYRPTENCHALQLLCKESDDTVILFRPPAAMDFAAACEWLRTWRKAWSEDSGHHLGHDDPQLHKRDEIQVPYVKLETKHDFASDLDSLRFYKGQPLPRQITRAEQRVEFELHERGARVRAEVSMDDPFGGPPEPPVYPRRFLYDAPFFVFLWRDGAEWPYFGSWIGDTSAMEKID
ncbi:hypothetical protein OKA05_24700 [Luteolibacter arcticus]|uniref:Serpin domain-containing protein n=1 Tax=Luteolibacter arcticus TaxID=1581411 RepID=A0ABT3GQN0_9BACT|nr:hypothetical protein [Luteolibacter arcticus]MCW1925781.1 hypothetical protein [Luteolibacter arcticus]